MSLKKIKLTFTAILFTFFYSINAHAKDITPIHVDKFKLISFKSIVYSMNEAKGIQKAEDKIYKDKEFNSYKKKGYMVVDKVVNTEIMPSPEEKYFPTKYKITITFVMNNILHKYNLQDIKALKSALFVK